MYFTEDLSLYGRSMLCWSNFGYLVISSVEAISLFHLPLDQMVAILQTIISDEFSWMTFFVLRIKFNWSLFLRVQLTMTQHWFRQWIGTKISRSLISKLIFHIYRSNHRSILLCVVDYFPTEAVVAAGGRFQSITRNPSMEETNNGGHMGLLLCHWLHLF